MLAVLGGYNMANLVVRNIDDDIVKALKARAGMHGHSAEAEHRLILESALQQPKKKSFSEAIRSIPNVGSDSDFERVQSDKAPDVFN
jgi:antitoxin FitA